MYPFCPKPFVSYTSDSERIYKCPLREGCMTWSYIFDAGNSSKSTTNLKRGLLPYCGNIIKYYSISTYIPVGGQLWTCSYFCPKYYSIGWNILVKITKPPPTIYLLSSFSMITIAVTGCVKLLGVATDAVMVKRSSSSSTVSPVMLISWHTELPTIVVDGMVSVWSDSAWKSLMSAENI